MTSKRVALTAAFLALAAGGTAACDAPAEEDDGYTAYDSTTYTDDDGGSGAAPAAVADLPEEPEEPADEVFYCADEEGEIVDEEYCDVDEDESSDYFLWYSPSYPRGLAPGTFLDGGDAISAGDREARRAFKLPPTGKVGNGVVKTNVVGRGSSGGGLSGGDSAGG